MKRIFEVKNLTTTLQDNAGIFQIIRFLVRFLQILDNCVEAFFEKLFIKIVVVPKSIDSSISWCEEQETSC